MSAREAAEQAVRRFVRASAGQVHGMEQLAGMVGAAIDAYANEQSIALRGEHEAEAKRLIHEGHRVLRKISDADDNRDRDAYGKQVMGIWAQAQVHATLALVEAIEGLDK